MGPVNTYDKFSCVVIGEDSLLISCSETLLQKEHKILFIVSENPKIKNWAETHNITCIKNDPLLEQNLSGHKFNYLFSITNLKIIPENILSLPVKGAVNFHDGPLPKYAGINATSWALMNNEKSHGITWHLMTSGIDEGAIVKQTLFEISSDETALTLNTKCFESAATSFNSLVDELASGTVEMIEQVPDKHSYYSKYQKPESTGIISWKKSAQEISSLIRALNYGNYPNPLAVAKIRINHDHFIVKGAKEINTKHHIEPGVITEFDSESITVAARTGFVVLSDFETLTGKKISVDEILAKYNLSIGSSFDELSDAWKKNLTNYYSEFSKNEPYCITRLKHFEPIDIPFKNNEQQNSSDFSKKRITMNQGLNEQIKQNSEFNIESFIKTAFALFIGKLQGKESYDIGYVPDAIISGTAAFDKLFSQTVPFHIDIEYSGKVSEQLKSSLKSYEKVIKSKTYLHDIIARTPELKHSGIDYSLFPVMIQDGNLSDANFRNESKLILFYSTAEKEFYFVFNNNSILDSAADRIINQFNEFITNLLNNPDKFFYEVSLLTPAEKQTLLYNWNNTSTKYDSKVCIHQLFEEQVKLKPTAIAVACNGNQISYDELNNKSSQLANYLLSKGVEANTFVGISLNRSINMMIAILGVLKAGGAYVPIDPLFPKDRTALMIEDSECTIIITESSIKNNIDSKNAEQICIDSDWNKISNITNTKIATHNSSNLAYVIYTSGSTGKPKGVMVNHRNVVNFFAGMDQHIKYDDSSAWLAVTSLSFDISVLELLWTLTRGLKVVLYTGDDIKVSAHTETKSKSTTKIDFSLFYFSSYEGEKSENKYKLLIEGAKFGDKNDFTAMWTPERHFYDFGGLYANPSVTSAAISTITEKIKLRAGSVVSPLHSTIRIAEEWSMVDNLSQGRVAIAFAAGWQPNDFVIMPQNFEDRKNIMFKQVEEIQKLWQGESVSFKNPNGKMIDINILPKPVQKKLPVWITAAGNPETFEMAGKAGYNLLTHLLGQSISEVGEKIKVYRKAWKEAGHEGEGNLTLMLHTFVGPDERSVKETVREPMKNYLRSAVNLVKEAAWSFPTFKQATTNAAGNFSMDHLAPEDLEAVLDYSFERYYETSGLFGTPESCQQIVEDLKQIGVDEIACLIDFGIDSDLVLAHLHYLNQLRINSNKNVGQKEISNENFSIESLIRKHNVTHMQCTPSMAKMLTIDESSTEALSKLKTMLIGGEAFPVNLAKKLLQTVSGDLFNMYGPTETTIWSTIHKLSEPVGSSISIGKPIANTQIYMLDKNYQLVPAGIAGELCIGGDGVTDGYYNRSELTDDRFISNPFSENGEQKIYRTGDLAYFSNNGTIEFLGRLDHQVKIRGYRIELGDIESQISAHPDVKEAIVLAREDTPGDQRLVAYLIPANGTINNEELKEFLKGKIPEYMVPAHYVSLSAYPLTPNGKIDRKAFPLPTNGESEANKKDFVLPTGDLEVKIADIWQNLLNVNKVGIKDNFFDIGGHSLLAVQLHSKLKNTIDESLTLIDIFRYPTITTLIKYLNSKNDLTEETTALPVSKRVLMSKQRKSRLKS